MENTMDKCVCGGGGLLEKVYNRLQTQVIWKIVQVNGTLFCTERCQEAGMIL